MALSKPLPSNATFNDVAQSLARPREHVTAVLHQLVECRKRQGDAFVRMGVTGKGIEPSHQILYTSHEGRLVVDAVYNTDAPWLPGDANVESSNWSTATMTEQEVRELLLGLRSARR